MPLITSGNGVKWGAHGKKYKYTPGNKASKTRARGKALTQMRAIKSSQARAGKIKRKRTIESF